MRRDRHYWLRLTNLALVALAAGVIGSLVGYNVLGSTIYVRAFTHPGCGEMGLTPDDVGIEGTQDITYLSHDGLMLRAWYLPTHNGASIILLPGLGGARDGMLPEGAILARHGYGLLMTELRSCAHPAGQSTLGYREATDLKEAVTWVSGQPGVTHVGALGFSMGGVTAILGAAQDERIEAIIAEGGFYDLTADITDSDDQGAPLTKRLLYSLHPLFFRWETGVSTQSISPIRVIGQISPHPLLLIYGDQEAESGHAWDQYEAAGAPTTLWIVPNCGHGGYLQAAPEEWERRVIAFFDMVW